LASVFLMSGRYGEQLAAAERATTLARAAGDERIAAAAASQRGNALVELGRHGEALPVLEDASRLAEALGDLDTFCWALNMAGCVYEDRGAFATAQLCTEHALAVAEQWGDPALLVYLTVRRGVGAFFSGDWARARADYERALALCRQVGESYASPIPLLDLGRLCLAEGAWEEAVRYLEESCAISRRSGNLNALRWAQLELAEHDMVMGHPEAARARLVPLLDRPGLEEGQVMFLLAPLAQAHLEVGDVEQAAALVGQSVQRARAQHNRRALVNVLRVQALVLTRQQSWAEAERAVEEGLMLAREMPYPYVEARLLHVYGMLQIQRGELGPARGCLEAALAIFQQLGARKDSERTEQAIAQLGPPPAVPP
jgi:tetratricopeptide (TPR) repeat protein